MKLGRVTGTVSLDSPHASECIAVDDHTLKMSGHMGPHPGSGLLGPFDGEGLKFEAQVIVHTEGGNIAGDGDAIQIRQADVATLIYTAATSYRSYRDISGKVKELATQAGKRYSVNIEIWSDE